VIRVKRGLADSKGAEALAGIERDELVRVRELARAPTGDEIGDRYRVALDLLWERQHHKCAYCENVEQRKRNDVEHFRPKARAARMPGSAETHGYWWLAWRWENLLFSCRNCNQSSAGGRGKLDKFPLEEGSGVLRAEQDPYGAARGVERPLLIDPSIESGVEHIQFVPRGPRGGWKPIARGGSPRGIHTIEVCVLDRDDLLELYTDHVENEVRPRVNRFDDLHPHTSPDEARRVWSTIERELYRPGMAFIGLSYDALCVLVADDELSAWGITREKPL
jgi:hypothetical protein